MSASVTDTYEVSESTSNSMADPSNSVKTVKSYPGDDSLQSGMQPNMADIALKAS